MGIERGQIYFVNLNPTQGREQDGERPVLVISNDAINKLPLVVTVVVGTKGKNISKDYFTNIRLSTEETGLPMETVFLCFQIRSFDANRFPEKPESQITDEAMERIEEAIKFCLDLD
jgi:mRNA interferase MazF